MEHYKWDKLPRVGDKIVRTHEISGKGKMIKGNVYTVKKVTKTSVWVEEIDFSWTLNCFAPANTISYEIY